MAEIRLSIPDDKVKDILQLIGYSQSATSSLTRSNGTANGKHQAEKKVWGVATKIVQNMAAKGVKFSSKDLARQCEKKGLTPVAFTTPLNRMVEQGKITRLSKGTRGKPSLYKAA